jgi:hypothetical protein
MTEENPQLKLNIDASKMTKAFEDFRATFQSPEFKEAMRREIDKMRGGEYNMPMPRCRSYILDPYSGEHVSERRNYLDSQWRAINIEGIGNINCVNNARSPHLQCAVNPTGNCSDCSHFEEIKETETVEVRDITGRVTNFPQVRERTSCPQIRVYRVESHFRQSIGVRPDALQIPRESLHLQLNEQQRLDLIAMLVSRSGGCEIILNGEEMRVE